MTDKPNFAPDPKITSLRPDPFFKSLTLVQAEVLGLQAIETEFQYSSRADLVLTVPSGVTLDGTMFEFFRETNVVEFKSQNDQFTLSEYIKNEIRTDLLFLRGKSRLFSSMLNVIISARAPQKFFYDAKERGIIFQTEETKPWLWRGRVGFQDVAIVVCRDLPIEDPFYTWLAFAPTESRKWRDFVLEILRQNNQEVIKVLEDVRAKDLNALLKQHRDKVEKVLNNPENRIPMEEPSLELQAELLLEAVAYDYPEQLGKVLSVLKPKERMTDLTPEDRLEDLTPEDRLAGLTSEERKKLLKLLQEYNRKGKL